MENLNAKLSELATKNDTARNVFKAFASRTRFRRETDLDRFEVKLLSSGAKISNDEYNEIFKELEKSGVGAIVYGRGGNPTRFKWFYNLKDVGKAALESTKEEPHKLDEHVRPSQPARKSRKGKVGRPKDRKTIIKEIVNNIGKLLEQL